MAQVRYYLRQDPGSMTDEEFAIAWQDLRWCREEEVKREGERHKR